VFTVYRQCAGRDHRGFVMVCGALSSILSERIGRRQLFLRFRVGPMCTQLSPSCMRGFADRQDTHTPLDKLGTHIFVGCVRSPRARLFGGARARWSATRDGYTTHPSQRLPRSRVKRNHSCVASRRAVCVSCRQTTYARTSRPQATQEWSDSSATCGRGNNLTQGRMVNKFYGRRSYGSSGPNDPSCPVIIGRRNGLPVGKRVN
jgi:hypothetical protein